MTLFVINASRYQKTRLQRNGHPDRLSELIGIAIDIVEEAPFLTEAQKRDILYNNAARFLRLSDEQIASHYHGQASPARPSQGMVLPGSAQHGIAAARVRGSAKSPTNFDSHTTVDFAPFFTD